MTIVDFAVASGPDINLILEQIGDLGGGAVLENAVVAGALPIANRAKELLNTTPSITGRESITESGDLARSIHVGGHTSLTPDFAGDDIGGNEHSATFASVLAGTNKEYARRVEYGFMGKDSLGREYHQPAQPYLRPAFDEGKESFRAEVIAALNAQVRRRGA